MNRFATLSVIGISVLSILATIDAALGLGGGAFLVDICRTILAEDRSGEEMAGMSMEIKTVPLIAISLAVTLTMISVLYFEQLRAAAGLSKPDEAEKSAIMLAILAAAASHRNISRAEFIGAYRSVAGQSLEPELVDYLYEQSRVIDAETLAFPRQSGSIARRRAIAAALIVGNVARAPNAQTAEVMDRLVTGFGATDDDVQAAAGAVRKWQEQCQPVNGVSSIMLLWGQRLSLKPAATEIAA